MQSGQTYLAIRCADRQTEVKPEYLRWELEDFEKEGWRPPKLTATIGVEHVKSLGINHKGQGKNDTRTVLHKSTLCISLS